MMKKLILFFGLLFLFTSCENILVKTLDIDDFDYEKQMAVSGTISSTDEELRILISENQAITDPLDGWNPLQDVDVSLFRGPALLGNLEFQPVAEEENDIDGVYTMDLSPINIDPGEYRLELNHPELGMATATTQVPNEVKIDDIVFQKDFGIAPNLLQRTDAIIITFNDPPEENYYQIKIENNATSFDTFIFEMDTIIYEDSPYIQLDVKEQNAQIGGNNILLTDVFFNGETYELVIYITDFSEEGVSEIIEDMRVSWEVLSKDKYEFDSSLELYFNSQGLGPFSEAVSVYNNVEGGLGVFAGVNQTFYDIPE